MIGGGEQRVGIDAGDTRYREGRFGPAGGNDGHAQRLGAGGEFFGDGAEADDAQRGPGDGCERRRGPAIGAVDPDIGQVLGMGKDRRQREFSEGNGR